MEEAVRLLSAGAMPLRSLPEASDPSPPPAALLRGRFEGTTLLTLTGRTLIVLGGAYALRALTDSGRVPVQAGLLLGVLYAIGWFAAADRASRARPQPSLSGFFHGVAAVVIGLPLLWEATTHFKVVSPATSAIGLAALTAIGLAVSAHRRLPGLAAVVMLGSLIGTGAFIVRVGHPLPFAAGLLVTGAATHWLAGARSWWWIQWPPALAVNVVLIGLISRAARLEPLDSPSLVLGLASLCAAAYVSPVVWRTIVGFGRLRPFDVVEASLSVALGSAGALLITERAMSSTAHTMVAGLILLTAAGAYVAAFAGRHPRRSSPRTVEFFSTVALVLVIVGVTAAAAPAPRVWVLSALTTAAMFLGARFSLPLLSLHGAVFNLSAASASGLLLLSAVVWLSGHQWPPLTWNQVLVVGVTIACAAFAPAGVNRLTHGASAWPGLVARLVVALTLIVSVSGLLVRGAGWLMGDPAVGLGALAPVKTAILSGAALVLAFVSRSQRLVEFGWLVYPVLVLGAVKLALDDLRHSTPGALFVAFAAYGAALVLAPRILRGR